VTINATVKSTSKRVVLIPRFVDNYAATDVVPEVIWFLLILVPHYSITPEIVRELFVDKLS
jgi:hypothetical protein